MSSHTFRNPDKLQVLPFREWLREVMPNGRDGFVAEDLDLLTRTYGEAFNADDYGRIRLVEIKQGPRRSIGTSKIMTFGLLDYAIRHSPIADRYEGFYVVRTDGEWPDADAFYVNDSTLTVTEFEAWWRDASLVEPMDFGKRFHFVPMSSTWLEAS